MKENKLDKRIMMVLTGNAFGQTIEETANAIGVSRATASKYLAVLEAKGQIISRPVGKAKLYYLRTSKLEQFLNK
ncbi:MAG: helix-turn-helix transcriptional regulator [Candidatus Aenigmarchaeota archaeon]|nr:helix-turn-helix transcriptional regulator [Candidatus Aenigmarchaeota archaeon]